RDVLFAVVDLDQRVTRPPSAHLSEVADRRAAQLGVLLALGEVDHARDVAAAEHRREHELLELDRRLFLIELPQLLVRAHRSELPNRFAAKLRVLLTLRGHVDAVFLPGRHERAEDPPLDVHVRAAGVDLLEDLATFTAALASEVADGAALQLRRRAALGDAP